MPWTTVPPLAVAPAPDADDVAIALLVTALILTAPPPMSMSCNKLDAVAFAELPLIVLELSECMLPYVTAPGWTAPSTLAVARALVGSACDVSVVPGIWSYFPSGVE